MSQDRESERSREQGEEQGPIIRDNRRIDPKTYQVREPRRAAAPAPEEGNDIPTDKTTEQVAAGEVTEMKAELAERTADLQRLQAEYVNYKRRVDRDRDLIRKATIEGMLKDLLNVLDDIRSAREHDELTGGFKAVADEVERITGKHGLETYGTKGDPFDPHIHEALLHSLVEGIDGPTCVEILQPGYRVGDRILRPARVAVADPAEPSPEPDVAHLEPVEGPEDTEQDQEDAR